MRREETSTVIVWNDKRTTSLDPCGFLAHTLSVVPAKAGTHTPCPSDVLPPTRNGAVRGYGSPPSRGRQKRALFTYAHGASPKQVADDLDPARRAVVDLVRLEERRLEAAVLGS